MAISLTWIDHASFRIAGTRVIYIDPWKMPDGEQGGDGDLVIVSHTHHDHCSPDDIRRVLKPGRDILAPADVVASLGDGYAAGPGERITLGDVTVETVRAYNPNKKFHPHEKNWLGFVLGLDGVRIYYAGDTDLIDEMGELRDIDVALLPVGGTYTMNPDEAAEACRRIQPALAIPYHYGDIVGTADDAQAFANAAPCKVRILAPGQSLELR